MKVDFASTQGPDGMSALGVSGQADHFSPPRVGATTPCTGCAYLMPRIPWQLKAMALLYLGYFSTTFGGAALSTATPDMKESFLGINSIVVDNMALIGRLAGLAGKLICAVAVDSLNGKAAFVGCLFVSASACVGFAMAGQVPVFTALWATCQLAQSGAWPSATKLVRGWFLPGQLGPAIAILCAASHLGDAASGHLLSLLLTDDTMDWQDIFLAAAAAMAAAGLTTALLMPGKAPPSRLLPLDMFGSAAPDVVAEKEIAKLRGWAWSRSSRFKVAHTGMTPKASSTAPSLDTPESASPPQSQKIIVKGHGQLRFTRQVSHRSSGSDAGADGSSVVTGGVAAEPRTILSPADTPGGNLHACVVGAAVDKADGGHDRSAVEERRVLVESNAHYTADERERVELLLHPLTGLTLWDVLVVISRSPTLWCACLASAALAPIMDFWVFAPIYFKRRLALSTNQAATCASFLPAAAAAALILGGTFYSRVPLRVRSASIQLGLATSSLLFLSLALYPDTLDPDTSVARLASSVFLTSVPAAVPLTEFALQFGGPPRCGLIISLIDASRQAVSVAFLYLVARMAAVGAWTVLAYVTCAMALGAVLFMGLFLHLTGAFSSSGPCLTGDLYSSSRGDQQLPSSLMMPRRPES
eukprot:jgi/Mesvir1/27299/Mv07131-RA.1